MSKKHPLKKYQTTIVMLILAAIMGGVVWVEYNKAKDEKVRVIGQNALEVSGVTVPCNDLVILTFAL